MNPIDAAWDWCEEQYRLYGMVPRANEILEAGFGLSPFGAVTVGDLVHLKAIGMLWSNHP